MRVNLMAEELTYARFSKMMRSDYDRFVLEPRRFRDYRLHLGEEILTDDDGVDHYFDILWFERTSELIAVEVEESYGTILPLNFKLKKSTDRYAVLGSFTEQGINELLPYQGRIIQHLWAKWFAEGHAQIEAKKVDKNESDER